MKVVSISSVCSTIKDTIDPHKEPNVEFTHYSIPAFDEGEPIQEKGNEIKSNKIVLNQSCILFSRLNPRIRRVWDLSELSGKQYSITSTEFVPFVIKDNSKLQSRYLYWFLHTNEFLAFARAGVQAATKSRERVKKDSLFQVKIPLPPLEEQKRIAAILDKADEVRRKRQEAIALTEELARSRFLDLFGDPVTNKNGWDVVELGELLSIVSGQVDPRSEPYIDMPHIGGENIESHTGNLSDIQTPRELSLKSGKYLFEPNDVLYSKIRPYLNKAVIPGFTGVCSADIYPLRVDETKLNQDYLVHLLRSQSFLDYAEKHSTRTNIPKINRPTLQKFTFPYPPITLQEEFSILCDKVRDMKNKIKDAAIDTENLFNSLLQRAFKGEL